MSKSVSTNQRLGFDVQLQRRMAKHRKELDKYRQEMKKERKLSDGEILAVVEAYQIYHEYYEEYKPPKLHGRWGKFVVNDKHPYGDRVMCVNKTGAKGPYVRDLPLFGNNMTFLVFLITLGYFETHTSHHDIVRGLENELNEESGEDSQRSGQGKEEGES